MGARAAWAVFGAVAAALLTLLLTRLFGWWQIDADQVNNLFIAQDWARGNWRLSGWFIAPDNYVGLEIPLTAAVWAVTQDAVLTLRLMPALAWVFLSGAALYVTFVDRAVRARALSALAVLLIVPIHERNGADFIANSPLHVMTVGCILIAIGLAARAAGGARWAWVPLALVTLDAGASDPMFLLLGAVPLAAASVVADLPVGAPRWRLVALTLGAPIVGRWLIGLNMVTGGFLALPTPTAFAPFAALPFTFGATVQSVLDVLGADPFGLSLAQAENQLLRLPLAWLVGAVLWRAARPLWARRRALFAGPPALALTETALVLVVVADLAAMLLTSNIPANVGPLFLPARFLLPGWAAAAVLVARLWRPGPALTVYAALLLVLALGTDTQVALRRPLPAFAQVDLALTRCLARTGLTNGFGTYWRAGTVTLLSGGRIRVRPVNVLGGQVVLPYHWMSRANWYLPWPPAKPFFVITQADDNMVPPADVAATFGASAALIPVGDSTIWVYGVNPGVACPAP